MAKKVLRTIAFQVDDWDFLKEYDKRQQESGFSVKNYFVNLIKADIAMHKAQESAPEQEADDQVNEPEQTEDTPEPTEDAVEPERQPGHETWSEPATPENAPDNPNEPSDDVNEYLPKQDAPEEMMNLFVKITKEQREALDAHKIKTGETVGNVVKRLIDRFLDCTGSLSDDFEEAYKRYADNIKSCNTTCSAKIPVRVNQELTDYLNEFNGSRNALMATLVEMELKGQELTQEQTEDSGITMQ